MTTGHLSPVTKGWLVDQARAKRTFEAGLLIMTIRHIP